MIRWSIASCGTHIGKKHRCFYLTPVHWSHCRISTTWRWRWTGGTKAIGEFLMIQFNLKEGNFRISMDFSTKPTSGYIWCDASWLHTSARSIRKQYKTPLLVTGWSSLLFWLQKEYEASQVLQWSDKPFQSATVRTHPRVDRTSWKFNSSIHLIQIIG